MTGETAEGRSAVSAKAGAHKNLFQQEKWVSAFAKMTLREMAAPRFAAA
jgi:hypothetical protein